MAGMSRRQECGFVCVGSLLLAVLMTWPTLRHPATTVPGELADPVTEAWMASWGGHALISQPTDLFQGNTFWPLPDSYAFNDTLLGYAPLTVFDGGQTGALVSYNVLFVLAYGLAFAGAYFLARQLGARPIGSLVAAAAFAYAPWRLAHAGHLNILSSGGIPLALAMLARGHGYGRRRRPRRRELRRLRPWWVVAGWVVAAWQVSLGFALGLAFSYLLVMVAVAAAGGWLLAGRPSLPKRLVVADVAGGLVFTAVVIWFAVQYLRVVADHPEAARGPADLAAFSPHASGFLIAPEHSWLWGSALAGARADLTWPSEMALLPGFLVVGLAIAGILAGAAPLRRRLWLTAVVVATVVFGLGTTLAKGRYTILPVQAHLPGWESVRTSGRLVIYTTLALGLLAAFAVTAWQEDLPRRRPVRMMLLLLPVLVLMEGHGAVPHPEVPAAPRAFLDATPPVLVLPSDYAHDNIVMFWSTENWPAVVNGSTAVQPQEHDVIRQQVKSFPDATSVDFLRRLGVRTVVLLPGYAYHTPWQDAEYRPVEGLPLTRRQVEGGDWVYHLNP